MANFYRVKDGNWNLADSWATTSGGTTYHANPPTSSDDVFFDANTPTGTHTVNTSANTLSLDFTGFTGTLAGSYALNIYGSLTLNGGMTNNLTGGFYFLATSGIKTITTNGIVLKGVLLFNGSGGTFQLLDNLETRSNIQANAGTFDPNGKTVTMVGSNQTITPNVALSFYNLNITPTVAATYRLFGNITVTNTLTIKGASASLRLFLKSNTLGTARTLTAATVSVTNADFQDITGAGAGSWDLSAITGGSGDCGGNTDITFTTADDWYWHADTGNVSDYSKWYTATNGGGSQMASTRVPLPQDTLKFDANSFDSASQTITQNMSRIGSIDFTGATNTPTFTTSTTASVFGSITLISGMTLTASTQTYTFEGKNITHTLDSGGLTWEKPIIMSSIGGTLTLKSDLIMGSTRTFTLLNGTFSAVDGENNYNVTSGAFVSDNNLTTRVLTMGSGTWELNGNLVPWNITSNANLTVNANTSTIKITGTLTANRIFYSGARTYNNLWISHSGAYAVTIYDTSSYNDFKIDAGREVRFTAGTNTTVTTFTAEGTDVAPITLTSNTTSAATLTKAGGGTITVKYCDISYLTATPADTWLAYTTDGNVDSGNNTGWTFVSGDTRRRAAFIKFF